jgi:hypothetical protein
MGRVPEQATALAMEWASAEGSVKVWAGSVGEAPDPAVVSAEPLVVRAAWLVEAPETAPFLARVPGLGL